MNKWRFYISKNDIAKTLTDTLTLLDALVKSPTLRLTDVVSVLDQITVQNALMKQLADSFTLTDKLTTINVNKLLADTFLTTDALERNIQKLQQDTFVINDTINKGIGIALSDTLTVADVLSKSCYISLVDAFTLLDAINRGVGLQRTFSDSVSLTDFISRELQIKLDLQDVVSLMDIQTFASEHLQTLNFIIADTPVTVELDTSEGVMQTVLLINSGIYRPAYLPTTDVWGRSLIQATSTVDSLITIDLKFITKLKGYHG